jgi:hypothetical protein
LGRVFGACRVRRGRRYDGHSESTTGSTDAADEGYHFYDAAGSFCGRSASLARSESRRWPMGRSSGKGCMMALTWIAVGA